MNLKIHLWVLALVVFQTNSVVAAVCWYTDATEVRSWYEDKSWGVTDLSNHTCQAINLPKISKSTELVDKYDITYHAEANGEYSSGDLGLSASTSIDKHLESELSRSLSTALPTTTNACIHWKIEPYDRYEATKIRQSLHCFSLFGVQDKGGKAKVWVSPWQGTKRGWIYADLETYQNSNWKTKVGPSTCKHPPCPCTVGNANNNASNAVTDDPDLLDGNSRELGFALPGGDGTDQESLALCRAETNDIEAWVEICSNELNRYEEPERRAEAHAELMVAQAMMELAPTFDSEVFQIDDAQLKLISLLASQLTPALSAEEPLTALVTQIHLLGFIASLDATVPYEGPPPEEIVLNIANMEVATDQAIVAATELASIIWAGRKQWDTASRTLSLVAKQRATSAPRIVDKWAFAKAGRHQYQLALGALADSKSTHLNALIQIGRQAQSFGYHEDALDAFHLALKGSNNPTAIVELMRIIALSYLDVGDFQNAKAAIIAAKCQFGRIADGFGEKESRAWNGALDLALHEIEKQRRIEEALDEEMGGVQ